MKDWSLGSRGIAFLLVLVMTVMSCFAFAAFAEDTEGTVEYFGFDSQEEAEAWEAERWDGVVPEAVVNPALVGSWGFHDEQFDMDVVWTFEADGTGNLYNNGMDMPFVSYVATTEPFSEYEEDGFRLTVYWGESTVTMGDTTVSFSMDPVSYGYIVNGDSLRIIYSPDIIGNYLDLVRE